MVGNQISYQLVIGAVVVHRINGEFLVADVIVIRSSVGVHVERRQVGARIGGVLEIAVTELGRSGAAGGIDGMGDRSGQEGKFRMVAEAAVPEGNVSRKQSVCVALDVFQPHGNPVVMAGAIAGGGVTPPLVGKKDTVAVAVFDLLEAVPFLSLTSQLLPFFRSFRKIPSRFRRYSLPPTFVREERTPFIVRMKVSASV